MDTLVLPQLAITKVYPFVRSTGAPLYQPECTVAIPSTTSCLVGLRQSLAKNVPEKNKISGTSTHIHYKDIRSRICAEFVFRFLRNVI
uniref:Uncharacterized protein n=1 Tax=Candidatus Kentrum sp. SD TaxID=2126332 RepID=A0A450YPI2_9GAMM|nr:MAG: hypothetical protein BECKSD772F_GA0070984_11472 [Candidatus Kentron sp. SD]VFK45064.1 MAG: hypothetical protein BECKSD772E_GA0070983_104720 [Candidatus Kentron sp. SD]